MGSCPDTDIDPVGQGKIALKTEDHEGVCDKTRI